MEEKKREQNQGGGTLVSPCAAHFWVTHSSFAREDGEMAPDVEDIPIQLLAHTVDNLQQIT